MITPSYKIEIEYYMIATLILNPKLLKTLPFKSEHFYHHNNLLAYQVLKEMEKENEAISLETFGSRFWDKGGKISEIRALFSAEQYYTDLFADTYLKILAEETAKRKILEKYNDLADAPREFIEEMKKIELEFINERPKDLTELYGEYLTEYNFRKEKLKKGGSVGLITGFKYIDQNCAFDKGDLIILAAKTSVGKTALAINIAVNCSMFDQRVLFFSAEMTANAIQNRIYAQLTGVAATRFKYCNADASVMLVKAEIENCGKNLKIIEAGDLTSEDVCRIAQKESMKPDLIVVDYIQYLKDRSGKNATNNDRIGNITRNLHALAQELKCSVLALSQVNRAAVGMPELHNLRDSGNIEQDSEIVLILHREDREDTVAQLIIAKNRNGQVRTDGKLNFDRKLTKFYE